MSPKVEKIEFVKYFKSEKWREELYLENEYKNWN